MTSSQVIQAFVLTIIALIAHESGHFLAIKLLKIKIKNLKILGFGVLKFGIEAEVGGIEKLRLRQRYIVHASGPIANIALVFIFRDFTLFSMINLGLGIFNLLPVFPLDGGRLLQNFLAARIGLICANRIILKITRRLGIVIALVGIIQLYYFHYNASLLFMGVYINRRASKMSLQLNLEALRALAAKNRDSVLPVKKIIFKKPVTPHQAVEYLSLDYWGVFYFPNQKPIAEREILQQLNIL